MKYAIEQVLTQIVAFLVMFWVLKKFAWKPLFQFMEERKQRIASDFETIKDEKKEIQQIKEDYKNKFKALEEESKNKIREAVETGYEQAQEIAKEARVKAQDVLNKATLEMEKEIRDAKAHLKNQVVDISMNLTKKIIGQEIDPDKHKQLIREALQQVEE